MIDKVLIPIVLTVMKMVGCLARKFTDRFIPNGGKGNYTMVSNSGGGTLVSAISEQRSTSVSSCMWLEDLAEIEWSTAGIIGALVVGVFSLQARSIKQRLMATEKNMEMETSELQLNDLTESFRSKSQLLEGTRAELKNLLADTVLEADRRQLLHQVQDSVILTEEEWRDFRDLFEHVHADFLVRLKERVPYLTGTEIWFLSLRRLGFSDNEMASMLGISTKAIGTLQSRLLSKIVLEDGQTLEDFIAAI